MAAGSVVTLIGLLLVTRDNPSADEAPEQAAETVEACESLSDFIAELRFNSDVDQLTSDLRAARRSATRSGDTEIAKRFDDLWLALGGYLDVSSTPGRTRRLAWEEFTVLLEEVEGWCSGSTP